MTGFLGVEQPLEAADNLGRGHLDRLINRQPAMNRKPFSLSRSRHHVSPKAAL